MDDLLAAVRAGDLRALRDLLVLEDVPTIVDELERLDAVSRAIAFRALPKDLALAVFEDLDAELQGELLDAMRQETVAELISGLDPDDRATLLDELPASVASTLLAALSPHEREMTTSLLGYPPDSAGRRMTPQAVHLPVHLSVGAALDHVRAHEADAEMIYTLPVVAAGREVVGVVSLRRLFVTDPQVPLREVMSDPIVVRATEDQEVAARSVRDHGTLAVPVVDGEQRLLGLFTVDDAMRILEHEESEDFARTGASEPLRRPYLATRVLDLVRSRILWLFVLIAAAALTVNVLEHFEDTLAEVVTLALFIPLLIGTGGNTGAQAVTTVVRAMALGDVRFRDLPRVVWRELVTGALLGTALAAVAAVPVTFLVGGDIALVLALALVIVCTLATTAGAVIPMVAKKVGVDPAVVSAPFITTLVDATGLIVYFVVAQAVLGL
ncbi:magnesium transporter [Actinotalea sp. BY-33]|uniref:Magnesium transporter MgtE n=1 Tax=Actinotalea soli TaxID=2819234 RepID=A0A939LW18_9CELL|nr:magnesium transporter [Actinotalea soli]MBO1753199.1 magnesium transporter [Actinotalea soli]